MLFLLYTYLSFCLGEDRCSVFLFWLRCALTFGELSIWREILERFSWHHFSLMYFKLHFLLWHGVHLKVGGGKDSLPSCILVIGYVISSWFYGWLHFPEGRRCYFCSVQIESAIHSLFSHIPCGLMKPALPRHQLWFWQSPYFVQSSLCSECI